MARKARFLIYEADDPVKLDQQLGRSANEGRRPFPGGEMVVVNVPDVFLNVIEQWVVNYQQPADGAL